MNVNQEERACRAWPILVERATQGRTITYGDLGQELGIHHRAVRYVLNPIQKYCLEEKLPPLTILVLDRNGVLGNGFVAYDVDKADVGQKSVYDYNWSAIMNPFLFAHDGTSLDSLIRIVSNNPQKSIEVYNKVRGRGYSQTIFRQALLSTYKSCAITGLTFQDGLEACHIIPWSKSNPNQRLDIRNGLLMNRFHHALFDKGLMTITKKYKIYFCSSIRNGRCNSNYDRKMILELHEKKIKLPIKKSVRPKVTFINKHNSDLNWGNELNG